jgi:hypothetical protein
MVPRLQGETLRLVAPYIPSMLDSVLVRRAVVLFVPAAALLTLCVALVYGAVQHVYRTSANDPQMQLATDASLRLDGGTSPRSLVGRGTVDLARSLAVHITVFGRDDQVLASNARLGGTVPTPPNGVLDGVKLAGLHWLTWQPRSGVRVAAVVVPWRGGTILVGRSLAPIEDREADLEQLCLAAWLLGLAGLAVAALVSSWLWARLSPGREQLAAR